MSMRYRVVSIGTLAAHPLWEETTPVRTGHATTTLVKSGGMALVIDPGLPRMALAARMSERTRVRPEAVTHVFLTSWTPDTSRGLELFDAATWWLHEPERDAALAANERERDEAAGHDAELESMLERDRALLERCRVAPDRLEEGVDLFPLPGVTPGCCGILISEPARTVLVCGDAVATVEHLRDAKVLPHCHDREQAQESFREAIQIADVLIPGRDNIMLNPVRGIWGESGGGSGIMHDNR